MNAFNATITALYILAVTFVIYGFISEVVAGWKASRPVTMTDWKEAMTEIFAETEVEDPFTAICTCTQAWAEALEGLAHELEMQETEFPWHEAIMKAAAEVEPEAEEPEAEVVLELLEKDPWEGVVEYVQIIIPDESPVEFWDEGQVTDSAVGIEPVSESYEQPNFAEPEAIEIEEEWTPVLSRKELKGKTVRELKALCLQRGIKAKSTARKADLINLLS